MSAQVTISQGGFESGQERSTNKVLGEAEGSKERDLHWDVECILQGGNFGAELWISKDFKRQSWKRSLFLEAGRA